VLKLANLALASPGHESNVRFKLIAARERTFRIPPIRTVISVSGCTKCCEFPGSLLLLQVI
jgi:hypothetical protein